MNRDQRLTGYGTLIHVPSSSAPLFASTNLFFRTNQPSPLSHSPSYHFPPLSLNRHTLPLNPIGSLVSPRFTLLILLLPLRSNHNQHPSRRHQSPRLDSPITIYCDSQPAISILKNEGDHTRSKHFKLKYHVTRERVDRKEIKVEYVKTLSNVADILTKGLSAPSISASTEALGLQTLDSVLNPRDQTSLYLDPHDPEDNSMTQEDLEALVYGN